MLKILIAIKAPGVQSNFTYRLNNPLSLTEQHATWRTEHRVLNFDFACLLHRLRQKVTGGAASHHCLVCGSVRVQTLITTCELG